MKLLIAFFSIALLAQPLVAQEQNTITLQQAVDLALKNNLNIQVEDFNPEIRQAEVDIQNSRFEALFLANSGVNDQAVPSGSALQGFGSTSTTTVDYNFTLQQLLNFGTSYSVDFRNSRTNTNRRFTSLNPAWDTSLFATFTQPLMRNFGKSVTLMPLNIAKQNQIASDYRLKQRVMDIVLQVEQDYWDLVFARKDLDVKKQSLTAAQDLYNNNKKQVEVGTMAPLEVVVAEAEVAAREEGLIASEALIHNNEDRLKTLVLGDVESAMWTSEWVPSDEPTIAGMNITEQEAIQQAIAENPDLKALTADMESRKLDTQLAHNALRPQLDLKASLGFSGLGGRTLIFQDDDPFTNPNPIGAVAGGYGDSLSNMFDNPTYNLGFVVSIPLGNKAAKSSYIRADLTTKQAERTLENARQLLSLNVRTTLRNLQSDLKRLDAARASRTLQEKKLDAERKKLNVGLSTNHVVLQFQDDLAKSQSEEFRATVDYNKNRAQLARYLGKTEM